LLGESLWALKVLMREEGLCQSYIMPPLQSLSMEEESKLISVFKKTIIKQDTTYNKIT